jgi:hypothetical protein
MTRPDDQPTPPTGPGGQQPGPPAGPWGQQAPQPGPWGQPTPPPGSWGPPSGPGAPGPVDWDATPPRVAGQQPPPGQWPGQPGQWPGQPGQWPGQPGPHGGPPTGGYSEAPTGMSTTRIVLITLGAVLAAVGLAVVLLLVVVRDDDRPVAAPAASAPSSAAPSSAAPSSAAPSRSAASSSAPSSASATAVTPEDLVGVLPVDLADCAAGETAGDGDLAAATCGQADTQPGPAEANFHLYPDVDTLDDVFLGDADDLGLAELPVDVDCSTEMGYGEWTYAVTGETGGLLACGLTDDGRAVVAWTDDEFLIEGALLAPGTTQEDVSALFDWWTEHSDYTG